MISTETRRIMMEEALLFARKQLEHDKVDCWATGPRSGDVINDLIACPGCEAIRRIDAALAVGVIPPSDDSEAQAGSMK